MAVDPTSPIAPARVRALLVPVGPVKKTRFASFTRRLYRESSVRLGDISPDTRSGRTTFSPLAFPNGVILYNMCTSVPPSSHAALSTFETFRETLIIFGIADANEHELSSHAEESILSLKERLDDVVELYPKSLVSKLLVFDTPDALMHKRAAANVIYVPTPELSRSTTMKTMMCDVSAEFLAELSSFANTIQNLQSLESPGAAGLGQVTNGQSASSRSLELTHGDPHVNGSRPETPPQSTAPIVDNSSTTTLASLQPSVTNSRPSSPANLFDTLRSSSDIDGEFRSNEEDNSIARRPRPKSLAVVRDSSRDRRPQPTASISSTERARNRLKVRQGIVIGTLHLQAGRWTDALRELVDSTTRARAFGDHVWHAKGLENILATLLLLAWSNSDFQIPKICYSISDKSAGSKPSSGSMFPEIKGQGRNGSTDDRNQALSSILPDLVHMIVNNHVRAYSFQGEGLPQLPFSECVIRLSYLLAIVNRQGGSLTREALQAIVLSKSLVLKADTLPHPPSLSPSKRDVSSLLFRAYPANAMKSGVPLRDVISIYSGMASVLSLLGLHRKRAILVKEMLSILVPSLIQARKVGAAEMGIHPAASLAALHGLTGEGAVTEENNNTDGEDGAGSFQGLLLFLCATYGILSEGSIGGNTNDTATDRNMSSANEDLLDSIVFESVQRGFGGLNLKVDILQLCANFSEALPNFHDVMEFTASLLRTAGPGIAPKPGSMDGLVQLSREEQVRLSTKLHRTLGVFPANEAARLETSYWDKFLVRGVSLSEVSEPKRLVEISHSELSRWGLGSNENAAKAQGPFLHNPFLKALDSNTKEVGVAAEEPVTFEVLLQNLYDFELIIEEIELTTEGVEFRQDRQNLVLGPFRIQRAFLTGIAEGPGELHISGCSVKFQGCSKQDFLLFQDAWAPDMTMKVKEFGLQAASPLSTSTIAASSKKESDFERSLPDTRPSPFIMKIPVEKEQPLLSIVATSSSQSIVSVLDGETQSFSITVKNDSVTSVVDFVHISFTDTTTKLLDVSDRHSVGPREIYESDYMALHRQPLRWQRENTQQDINIKPGETKTFEVSVFGRPGLSQGSVYINYAHLVKPLNEVKNKIYTRRVCLPLTITVLPSIHLQGFDIVPVQQSPYAGKAQNINSPSIDGIGTGSEKTQISNEPFFMLLLDLRNFATRPIAVQIHQTSSLSSDQLRNVGDRSTAAGDLIQPNQTVRLALRVSKLFVEDPHKPIPVLRPKSQRQHVVDGTRNAAHEKALIEAFWYRERLLEGLKAEWQEVSSLRKGTLDVRGINLNMQMVEVLRQDRVNVRMEVSNKSTNNGVETRTAPNEYWVKTDDFLTLRTTIRNQTNNDIRCSLTLQPKLVLDSQTPVVDMTKRVAWSGLLKRSIKKLKPSETVEIHMGLSFLSAGKYEINAFVDPMPTRMDQSDRFDLEYKRIPAEHPTLPDSAGSSSQRLGSASCRLIVVDD